MVVNYEQILKANEKIKTIDIKGNQYAEVNQRVKAFRMVYPLGFILTEMRSNVDGVCVFTATVGYYDEHGERCVLATGTAYERESANYINKTSFIEVCESSAVGRALGLAGFGIDTGRPARALPPESGQSAPAGSGVQSLSGFRVSAVSLLVHL